MTHTLPIEYLHECFRYRAGKLYWRVRPREHFVDDRIWKRWNTRYAGKEAGCKRECKDWPRWIVRITWESTKYTLFRYRIVFAMFKYQWPKEIDHKDRNTLNDALGNLRAATRPMNAANSKCRRHSSSGIKGVRHRGLGRYEACITIDRKYISLGVFTTAEQAHAAYCTAAKAYFGDFFNDGS